jgi:hypothetical protein
MFALGSSLKNCKHGTQVGAKGKRLADSEIAALNTGNLDGSGGNR